MQEVNQNIVEFLKKVADDEELQAKMQKATNPDEAYAIASAVQDGFTKEEFVETMQAINAQTDKELSEDDLAQVAGGGFWDDFKKSMSVVTKISSKVTSMAAKAAAA